MNPELPAQIRDLMPFAQVLQIKDILKKLMTTDNWHSDEIIILDELIEDPKLKDLNAFLSASLVKPSLGVDANTFDCLGSIHFDTKDSQVENIVEYLEEVVAYINLYLLTLKEFNGVEYELLESDDYDGMKYKLRATWREGYENDSLVLEKVHSLHSLVVMASNEMLMVQVENFEPFEREKALTFGNDQQEIAKYIWSNIQICWIVIQICARVRHNNSDQEGKN